MMHMQLSGATGLFLASAILAAACSGTTPPDTQLRELWYAPQPGFTRSRPAVIGDQAIFAAGSGQLIARSVETGAVDWASQVFGINGIQGANLIVAAQTIVAGGRTEIVAVNRTNGAFLWRYTAPLDSHTGGPGNVEATHLATDGASIFLPAWGASLSAVDLTTGSSRWVWRPGRLQSDTAATVFRSGAMGVAVSGDTVFVTGWHYTNHGGGTSEGLLAALDRLSGAQHWITPLSEQGGGTAVWASPVLSGGLAIVETTGGRLYAVDRSTGAIEWTYKSADYQYATLAQPALVENVLYVSLGDERLTAVRPSDGTILWTVPALGATRDIVATSRRIYVPSGGQLQIHDRASGTPVTIAHVKREGGAFAAAVEVQAGRVFAVTTEAAWSFEEP